MTPRLSTALLRAALLASVSMAASSVATAAETAPRKATPTKQGAQPDLKFLEYLGSLESDDDNWTDVASQVLAAPDNKDAAKPEAAAKNAAEKKR